MKISMRACCALATMIGMHTGGHALAGQTPYVAVVGEDTDSGNDFYTSPKHRQYQYSGLHDAATPEAFMVFDARGFPGRGFAPRGEQCDIDFGTAGNANQYLAAGRSGSYEWLITLPMRMHGNMNINIQCGLLKPNTETATIGHPMLECAGETGERIGASGACIRLLDQPGRNPVAASQLPLLYAAARNELARIDFNLTAYRNPGRYNLSADDAGAMSNSSSLQVLDGSTAARLALKSCFTKSVFTKIPVTGQVNALGQEEVDLERGDTIAVQLNFPRDHAMDVYCHAQSASISGLGDPLSATGTRRNGNGG